MVKIKIELDDESDGTTVDSNDYDIWNQHPWPSKADREQDRLIYDVTKAVAAACVLEREKQNAKVRPTKKRR